MSRVNCWEVKNCGREPYGSKVSELDRCIASTEEKVHGINHGKNGGRACWAITGTLCGGEVQGTFAKRLKNCFQCDFFKMVRQEEGAEFQNGAVVLRKLRT
jgi:hypothetical protein